MIRDTLAFASKDLLIVLRDKGVLAVYFLMPLLFASLLGLAFGNVGGEEKTIEIDISSARTVDPTGRCWPTD
jgi:hypothetical protein